jgi:hypothetical protein
VEVCILYFYWVHSIGVWVFVRFLELLFPTDVLYITESFLYPILIKITSWFHLFVEVAV